METNHRWRVSGLALLAMTALVGPVVGQDTSVATLYRESYQMETNRNPTGAAAKMREIRTRAGGSYFVAVRTGWLAYLTGEYDGAAAAYREACGLAPKSIEARLGLTMVLLAQKKWRELERACREVLALDPNHAAARARLAHAQYSLTNYPDAATTYRRLVEDYPAELDHQTGLGWALAKMGRRAEAKQMFAAVLAVSPDNQNAQQGMALP